MSRPPIEARFGGLSSFLYAEYDAELRRYEALCEEDQALRHAEYDKPDPKRRRLRVSCNECETPWCCNQLVSVDLVEALVLYRWAAEHAPAALIAAVARGKELHDRAAQGRHVLDDAEFFQRRQPCAFLVKGQCAVYTVRPHACRTHYMAGNPQKCRNELAPSETYAMDPDGGVIAELGKIAEDVRFFAQIEGVKPHELNQVLYLIERLGGVPRWKAPRTLE